MKEQIKGVVTLVSICAVVAVLMAITNSITAPIIRKNEDAAANQALSEVLPGGVNFVEADISAYQLPSTVTQVYTEDNGGCVVRLSTAGYSSGMILMCGINPDGTVSGVQCLSSGETLGYEKTYGESLIGSSAESIDSVDTVSGATKTTSAYRSAVKDALNTAIIIGGGSVDIRTDEEILMDNLSAALPAGDGKFSQMFVAEDVNGIDAVYTADNGSGYVFVCGEEFVGIDNEGKAASDNAELNAMCEEQAGIIIGSTLTELDLGNYEGLPTQVTSAFITATGNYVLEINASGFGINGDEWYNPSGEYIKVKIALTPDGRIINCLTVYQAETDGIGSACEEPWFYSQFAGKTADNYKEIDAISGATYTTNGYKTAVGKAFEAVKILKGEME